MSHQPPRAVPPETTAQPTVDPRIDKELSWLAFNRRVLFEATDPRNPILERAKFFDIVRSNLDEFFMKRVGGLKNQVSAQVGKTDRKIPSEVLKALRVEALSLVEEQSAQLQKLTEELPSKGINLVSWEDLTKEERAYAKNYFRKSIFPVLTPLAVDTGHPFPFMSNLSTSFGLLIRHPDSSEEYFARIKIPKVFPSWLQVNPGVEPARFLSLASLVGKHLSDLFPGMKIIDAMMFRVTRNADIKIDEDEDDDAEDLLELVSEGLRERRFARVVRLEHGPKVHPKILGILKDELDINDEDIYRLSLKLEMYEIGPLTELNRPDMKFPTWAPQVPTEFNDETVNIFDVIKKSDVLVHHPYESFNASAERFIKMASEDPKVLAIKMTLYRTGNESPFIPYLIRAAEAGKQVACLVELQARFDEERNIILASALEDAGVHVVYGLQGLKTHCKLALVVRNENDGVRCYAHIGTGNYHAKTSFLYTDLGLFTAVPEFTQEVVALFHHLTGRSINWEFNKMLVAPHHMKNQFLSKIKREAENAQAGKPAHIIAKMNGLEDERVIQALCEASQAGVKIDLFVRGICCLRPGIPGVSENIRVFSVIGRFLEHSRIFYFRNAQNEPKDGEIYIGSADWMTRNLNERVEAVVPLEAPHTRAKAWEILQILCEDHRQTWELQMDGSYKRLEDPNLEQHVGAQARLMELTLQKSRPALK